VLETRMGRGARSVATPANAVRSSTPVATEGAPPAATEPSSSALSKEADARKAADFLAVGSFVTEH